MEGIRGNSGGSNHWRGDKEKGEQVIGQRQRNTTAPTQGSLEGEANKQGEGETYQLLVHVTAHNSSSVLDGTKGVSAPSLSYPGHLNKKIRTIK